MRRVILLFGVLLVMAALAGWTFGETVRQSCVPDGIGGTKCMEVVQIELPPPRALSPWVPMGESELLMSGQAITSGQGLPRICKPGTIYQDLKTWQVWKCSSSSRRQEDKRRTLPSTRSER